MQHLLVALAVGALTIAPPAAAQTGPVNGVRPAEVRTHAITGATVVVQPGQTIERATIIIRDGVIEAVGQDVEVPPGARVWPGDDLTVYPGLIDAAVMVKPDSIQRGPGAHWNSKIHPEWSAADGRLPSQSVRKEMRSLGFTVAAVYPSQGVLRGSGVVIALADRDEHALAYDGQAMMAAGFDRGGGYPGSLMGAIALLRQTFYDAHWHAACRRVWQAYPQGNEPPISADALVALEEVVNGRQAVLFEVSDEHNALRAARLAHEFDLDLVLLGSGYEFRRLDDIVSLGVAIIVPLQFPDRPDVSALSSSERVTLRELMTWEQAPTNARRLVEAGATIALTTYRLKKRSDFYPNLRRAVKHGLDDKAALAALTTVPAKLLGLDHIIGTIESGKAANLVVVEGSLFEKKPKIRDVWINGRRHEISKEPQIKMVSAGTLETDLGITREVRIDTTKKSVTFQIDDEKIKAKKVVVQKDQISFVVDGRPFDAEGYVRLSGVLTEGAIVGTGALPDGQRFAFTISPHQDTDDEPEEIAEDETGDESDDDAGVGDSDAGNGDDEDESESESEEDDEDFQMPPQELVYPLGAYGFSQPPDAQDVLIINATVWTSGPDGIIEDGELEIRGAKIVYVGPTRAHADTDDLLVIDAAGKHLTAGLIDCHSHTGISGGVNEGGQTNTAEVRIGDVINPDDINFYRQLAGGLVAANQLHGSANPIGGQNSVIKLKWGGSAEDFRVTDAIAGIKFALGENVKRRTTRYPNTRMGVETFIRDGFVAARDYRAEWDRYLGMSEDVRARTMPPRRDLELDALVEILNGQRLVHCHSYRQDEILMLIRVADEFGFTIGTFQHVLEGYKIAEAIASHGAGASTFSDWWAYKIEVMDAIPYNGALMHDVGVIVSFNSDSSELARRMNTEAAKAVRYGGLDPQDALNFVTINPAKQLRIDHRTGSLEVGKDGDFVIWSESPLSTYARCEQTWIEGARYFEINRDRELRASAQAQRQRLIQRVLREAHGKPKATETDEPATPSDPTAEGASSAEPDHPDPPYSCCWRTNR
ncbi:MAG: amidohydrolase family protein [Planctomycetes bacterium]|nr:amidohydrolase family protein [Planctomycetota bacterium]